MKTLLGSNAVLSTLCVFLVCTAMRHGHGFTSQCILVSGVLGFFAVLLQLFSNHEHRIPHLADTPAMKEDLNDLKIMLGVTKLYAGVALALLILISFGPHWWGAPIIITAYIALCYFGVSWSKQTRKAALRYPGGLAGSNQLPVIATLLAFPPAWPFGAILCLLATVRERQKASEST